MELLGDMGEVEARFSLFEDSVNLGARKVQGCAGCTTGMEIFLVAPDKLLGDVGQMKAHFSRFEDNVNQDGR
jgi:hypothetical protein